MEKPRQEDYTQKIRVSNIFNQKTIELIKNKNILDLGIHQGHLSNLAFSFGAKSITGIESELDNCNQGKTLHPDIIFINRDLNVDKYLDLMENTDVIFCLGVSYYINDFNEMISKISFLSNIKTIIFETAFIEEDYNLPRLYTLLSEKTLTDIFTNNNFNIVETNKYKIDTEFPYMSDRMVFVLEKK
jgi:2-polyprenyl-3-methyl-5-hydroxy-6-metoxy-1,4-benzoquinol methylase